MLRARQTHLLHKNGAEWGSFIQEVLCLCSSVASRGTIGSQYVRPQETKTTRRLTWHTKIKQIHIPSIYSYHPYKENRISFFFMFRPTACSLLGMMKQVLPSFLAADWSGWMCSSCHLTLPPTLTCLPAPVPENQLHSLMAGHNAPLKGAGGDWKGGFT